ncbi:dihydrodipicolinate synthase family protein [Candidatus Bathyarchaeota archaeon]|nr:MAG: dihydrodipicolinate synthase family protein [Candidatus Bathyarchaeota archaeon]
MSRKDKLKGIVVSLPTPTKKNYEVDYKRFKEHVAWLVDQGLVEGKAVLMGAGGLGEGYFLTREEHEKIMEALVDAANGKVPTMTGIFEVCTKEAVLRARMAEDVGIDFLQVNPPHYLAPVDEEVYVHYKMINDSADIGIMIYNTPWCAMHYEIRPKLMERLAELNNIVGVKWTSFDPVNFVTMLKQFSDKLNFIDNSTLISLAFQLGAKGYISLLGNIAPKAELYLLNLLEKREYERFDMEYKRLHAWREVLSSAEEMGFQGIGEGTISKAIFEAVGKPIGPPLPPQRRVSEENLKKIRELLNKYKVFDYALKISQEG